MAMRKPSRWTIQFALPWHTEQTPNHRPRFPGGLGKKAATFFAERILNELGAGAKARIYNPKTGEYTAMVVTENEKERIKTYHGREKRSA
jgi:hypothetical protein